MPKNEPEGQGDLWSPPQWFDDEQREQWHYALDHTPPGLLTGTDRDTLVVWCCACVEYVKAVLRVRAEGQIVETTNRNVIINPYMSVMNKQALLMLKSGAEMGFSPAARASLGSRAPEFPNDAAIGGRRSIDSLDAYLESKPDKLNS